MPSNYKMIMGRQIQTHDICDFCGKRAALRIGYPALYMHKAPCGLVCEGSASATPTTELHGRQCVRCEGK